MTHLARSSAAVLLALAALTITACSSVAPAPSATTAPEADAAGCAGVSVVVDFGPLDVPSLGACAESGAATDILAAADITTEGTVDYGDQVVCRVNDLPSPDSEVVIDGVDPFIETCQTLNSVAYWALWVKTSADAEWEYAQEGVNTLQLEDGQSIGLVYTPGTDSIPPQD